MPNEVSTLKQHGDGDIVIAGSFQLVRTLIEHDLVDGLRLKIFPGRSGRGAGLLRRYCLTVRERAVAW